MGMIKAWLRNVYQSRKMQYAVLLFTAATGIYVGFNVWIGIFPNSNIDKITFDQWGTLMQWIFGIFAAGNAAEHGASAYKSTKSPTPTPTPNE